MACGISFFSDNLLNDAVLSLTTGTENAQFPLVNVKNDATAVKFRSQENDIVILVDLQQTRTIDTFAIHGDTNEEMGVTSLSFKTSLTTDFSSATAIPVTISADNLMGYEYITAVDHRFVEITLSGSGSFAEVSNIFIGERSEFLQQNISISSFRYGYNDRSSVSTNKYGQKFVDKRNKLKMLSGDIQYCIKSEQDILDEIFLRHGKSLPIWVAIDKDSEGMIDGRHRLAIYGYFSRTPQWLASGGQTYNTSIKVDQAG